MNTDIFEKLSKSQFRSKFKLKEKDFDYISKKGFNIIAQHAADFIAKRVAPVFIVNDGRQTPMRGHPVFIAQHAVAACCRNCIQKWHGFEKNKALSQEQQKYLVSLIMQWIKMQVTDKQLQLSRLAGCHTRSF